MPKAIQGGLGLSDFKEILTSNEEEFRSTRGKEREAVVDRIAQEISMEAGELDDALAKNINQVSEHHYRSSPTISPTSLRKFGPTMGTTGPSMLRIPPPLFQLAQTGTGAWWL